LRTQKLFFSWLATATPDPSGEARGGPRKKNFCEASLEWIAGLAS